MRNSAAEYNQQLTTPCLMGVFCMLLLYPPIGHSEQKFNITSKDMVAIHADQAWEDIEPEIVHFAGHFEMRIRHWRLNADRATLQGKLDDPERLVLQGSPARFNLFNAPDDPTEAISAEAQEIIYERETDLIVLNGAASLAQGGNVLHSSSIEYNIKTDRFHTRDQTDVQIKVNPPED